MARAIFQDWFVDFGPTRAKMEGQEPYLTQELWDLFPDELVDSELGEIPEGWEVKDLGQVVEVFGGATPSTKMPEYWEGGTHCWATPKDLSNIASPVLLDTERKITDSGLNKISSGLLPIGDSAVIFKSPHRLSCYKRSAGGNQPRLHRHATQGCTVQLVYDALVQGIPRRDNQSRQWVDVLGNQQVELPSNPHNCSRGGTSGTTR